MTLGITPEEIPEEFEVFRDIEVSFELFPPRSSEMEEQLWGEIKRLEPLAPRFVSVTYGAGGSTRDWRSPFGTPGCTISWPCAATHPAARPNTSPIPVVTLMLRTWSPA
jgi:hypothetical protein